MFALMKPGNLYFIHKNKGPPKTYERKVGDKVCHTSFKFAEWWAGSFTNMYAECRSDEFNNKFREGIEQLVDMKNYPIILKEILDGEVKHSDIVEVVPDAGGSDAGFTRNVCWPYLGVSAQPRIYVHDDA